MDTSERDRSFTPIGIIPFNERPYPFQAKSLFLSIKGIISFDSRTNQTKWVLQEHVTQGLVEVGCQQIEHEERRTLGKTPREGIEHIGGLGEGTEQQSEGGRSRCDDDGEKEDQRTAEGRRPQATRWRQEQAAGQESQQQKA